MRVVALRTLVALMALAFAASGVAAHYCNIAHHVSGGASAPASDAASHHAGHDGAGGSHKHHAHADHGPDHRYADGVADPLPAGDAPCSKCCGICTLAGAVAPHAAAMAAFGMATVQFAAKSDRFSGSPPRIDPGIPKAIV
jgi:hypothetical protein